MLSPFFYYTALYKESEFSIQHCIKTKYFHYLCSTER
nr:MAG TPA: hypothetical protein [Bacteriophage sp.]